jgi:hypothetical protein
MACAQLWLWLTLDLNQGRDPSKGRHTPRKERESRHYEHALAMLGRNMHSPTCFGIEDSYSHLQDILEAANWILAGALNHHVFKALCEEAGSEHSAVLLHTKVQSCQIEKI